MLNISVVLDRAGVERRPPISFLRRALRAAVLMPAVLLLLPVLAFPGAPGQGYRLAGTLAVGSDYVAFLEVPGGGQVLVRTGSVINGARVVAVSASSLKLALPSGLVEFSLEGSGQAPPASTSTAIISSSSDPKFGVYNREVAVDQMSRELGKPAAAPGAPAGAKVTAGQDSASQRIAAVLDLPNGSKILQIRGEPVSSAEQAIKLIQSGFTSPEAEGMVIDVQTPTGPGRVYLRRGDH